MKNLMKQIAMSLGLTLMVASLVVISPDQAQAKVKKQAGNSAKVKSQAKRRGSNAKVSMQDIHFSRAKVNSQANSSGSNANRLHLEDVSLGRKAKGDNLTDILVSGVKDKSNATRRSDGNAKTYESASDADIAPRIKRRRARNGKVRAGWDIRQPNM